MPFDGAIHRITTAEYEEMSKLEVFGDQRIELLDGQLVEQPVQNELHVLIVHRLIALCVARLDLMRSQVPLSVAEGWMPEPDLALVASEPLVRPTTAELVVEVSVGTRRRDLAKADLYAAAGIPRYWLVDVANDCVLEHTDPTRAGYGLVRRLETDDVLDARIDGVTTTTVAALLAH